MTEDLTKISEEIANEEAKNVDNWLRPLLSQFLPPDIDLDCLFANPSETKKWTDKAEVYGILKEKGLSIENHQTHEPLTHLYKLVQNGKILSELKYTTNLTV